MLLLAPIPTDANGGAAHYNSHIVDALRALGHPADLVLLHGQYPAAAPDPRDAAMVAGLPADRPLVLDGIALGLHAASSAWAAGLIHHPSPLHGEQTADTDALRASERAALAALPLLIAASAAVAARLVQDYGVAADRVCVVAPGVDTLPRRDAADRSGPCQLLSLGALVPRRAHDVLLRALALLRDLDWHLTLIGSQRRNPAYAAALRDLIVAEGMTARVSLAEENEMVPWERTDVFTLANPVPSMAGAIGQALRRGIPLVLATEDATPDPTEACARCPPGDVAALSKVLRRVIFDTGLRRQMAEAAWQGGLLLPDWERQAAIFQAALLRAKVAVH